MMGGLGLWAPLFAFLLFDWLRNSVIMGTRTIPVTVRVCEREGECVYAERLGRRQQTRKPAYVLMGVKCRVSTSICYFVCPLVGFVGGVNTDDLMLVLLDA